MRFHMAGFRVNSVNNILLENYIIIDGMEHLKCRYLTTMIYFNLSVDIILDIGTFPNCLP